MKAKIFISIMAGFILIFGVLCFFGCEKNHAPEILEVNYTPNTGVGGSIFTLTVLAVDEDQDPLTYLWTADNGDFLEGSTSSQVKWQAPILMTNKSYTIMVTVSDGTESVNQMTPIQVNQNEFGSLSGSVFYSGSTIPIVGVIIEVAGQVTSTDNAGEFALSEVPALSMNLSATKDKYNPVVMEVIIQKNENTDVQLEMNSDFYSTDVHGIVSSEHSGVAKSGATVVMLNPDGTESEYETTTNTEGYYELDGLPQGQRKLIVKIDGKEVYKGDILLEDASMVFNIPIHEVFEFTDSRDGNQYKAYRIGNQIWMIENLAYLPSVSLSEEGSNTDIHYYVYGFQDNRVSVAKRSSNYQNFGVLYNWPAAMNGRTGGSQVQGVCPDGWHLPSYSEWIELTDYLTENGYGYGGSGDDIAKSMASTSGWILSNREGGVGNDQATNNSSKFNAFPGGCRFYTGSFGQLANDAYFWSSDAYSSTSARYLVISYLIAEVSYLQNRKSNGFSVRCIQD